MNLHAGQMFRTTAEAKGEDLAAVKHGYMLCLYVHNIQQYGQLNNIFRLWFLFCSVL